MILTWYGDVGMASPSEWGTMWWSVGLFIVDEELFAGTEVFRYPGMTCKSIYVLPFSRFQDLEKWFISVIDKVKLYKREHVACIDYEDNYYNYNIMWD